jgi:hypothetical protein
MTTLGGLKKLSKQAMLTYAVMNLKNCQTGQGKLLDDGSKSLLNRFFGDEFQRISADWSGRRLTPGGISVPGETPQELATRRLGERPPESKRLERKSAFSTAITIKNDKGSEKEPSRCLLSTVWKKH